MGGFLIGASCAIALAALTFAGMNAYSVSSIERVASPSVNAEAESEFGMHTRRMLEQNELSNRRD